MSYITSTRVSYDKVVPGARWTDVEKVIDAKECVTGSYAAPDGGWMIVARDPDVGVTVLVERNGVPASYALDLRRSGTVEAWDGQGKSKQLKSMFLRESEALRAARMYFLTGELDDSLTWRPQDEVFLELWGGEE